MENQDVVGDAEAAPAASEINTVVRAARDRSECRAVAPIHPKPTTDEERDVWMRAP